MSPSRAIAAALAALITVAVLPVAAPAEPLAAAQADREALINGLEAQFQVGLIRERKLADDRETTLIDQAEAQLKAARAAADTAQGDARKANAELVAARAAYAQLAQSITQHDAEAQAEVAAYRAEAEGLAAQAPPEKLAALQRFADGDRVGAWPVIEALTDAEDKAEEAAANARRAVGQRQLASLRQVMADHGEATTADVLALYDKAADLDPSDFDTNIQRAKLSVLLGDLVRAKAAADQAASVATTDQQRSAAAVELASIEAAQGDHAGARKADEESVALLTRLATADPTSKELQEDLAASLLNLGLTVVYQGDRTGARKDMEAALGVWRKLAAADPAATDLQEDVADCLEQLGDQYNFRGDDLAGAQKDLQEALTIRQSLLASDPTSTAQKLEVAELLRRIGDVMVTEGNNAGALDDFQKALVIGRALVAADPSSAKLKGNVAAILRRIGDADADATLARYDDAKAALDEGLSIWQALAAADPTNADKQNDMTALLQRIGDLMVTQGDALDGKGDFAGAQQRYAAAEPYYQQGLAIRQRLAAADPSNTEMTYYVSSVLRVAGELQLKEGRLRIEQHDAPGAQPFLAAAMADFKQCVAIRQHLLEIDPASSDKQKALSLDYQNIGDVLLAQGDTTAAAADYQKSLAIRQRLAALDPADAVVQQRVADSLARLAALPGASVTWAQVVAQLQTMKTAGRLSADGATLLADAQARAASQGKPAP